MDGFLTLLRFEYDDPYLAEIHLTASNGLFTGHLEFFCDTEELSRLGDKLKTFPCSIEDQIVYEIGSEETQKRLAYYLRFHTKVIDGAGHCAIHFRINNNGLVPHNGIADFSLKANPAELNELGELLRKLASFQISDFSWKPHPRHT
jgi:hypothetical protein